MPKRVAVIDIGSNSMRLAIFERTSRLGFFILAEHKVKVRLGEGAYENDGILQEKAIQNALNGLGEFKNLIKNYGAKRILCIGTSALRDAPNSKYFINLVKKHHNIAIRCIDGKTEAYFGGFAALNLLENIDNATTIDIGGGSTELAKIENKKVIQTISLNLGTVRLKELFYDKGDIKGLESFIDELLSQIPTTFKSDNLIAIGGSLRAISNAIMQLEKHPLKLVHNFTYNFTYYNDFIKKIIKAKQSDLGDLYIKKDRFDTIKEGALIFRKIATFLGTKKIFTSGVGIREGVFLTTILGKNGKFPANFNPSIKSLQDRFLNFKKDEKSKFAKNIFTLLKPLHKIDDNFLTPLLYSAKLCDIGEKLGFYAKHEHAFYMILNGLNYGFSHNDKVLIASIIKLHGKKELNSDLTAFKKLLPNDKIVIWLSFILEFAKLLDFCKNSKINLEFENNTLLLRISNPNLMLSDGIKKINKPGEFDIKICYTENL